MSKANTQTFRTYTPLLLVVLIVTVSNGQVASDAGRVKLTNAYDAFGKENNH